MGRTSGNIYVNSRLGRATKDGRLDVVQVCIRAVQRHAGAAEIRACLL